MIYKSKADLLGRMWKARSDVRLIDRMICRGEVKKTDRWYEIEEKFFIKWVNEYDIDMTLLGDIERIREEVREEVKKESEWYIGKNNEYYEKKLGMYREWFRKVLEKVYRDCRIKPEYQEEIKEKIERMYWYIDNECDK